MGPWLITAGRVYDGVAERALERAYVVVDGDTITAVGPQQSWRAMRDVLHR